MALVRKMHRNTDSLPLSQRQRPRSSRVKRPPVAPLTPAGRLRLALELSDFCLALREAGRRKR